MNTSIEKLLNGNQRAADLHRQALATEITERKNEEIKQLQSQIEEANQILIEYFTSHSLKEFEVANNKFVQYNSKYKPKAKP